MCVGGRHREDGTSWYKSWTRTLEGCPPLPCPGNVWSTHCSHSQREVSPRPPGNYSYLDLVSVNQQGSGAGIPSPPVWVWWRIKPATCLSDMAAFLWSLLTLPLHSHQSATNHWRASRDIKEVSAGKRAAKVSACALHRFVGRIRSAHKSALENVSCSLTQTLQIKRRMCLILTAKDNTYFC